MYTSGTTSTPKVVWIDNIWLYLVAEHYIFLTNQGVWISHANIVATVAGVLKSVIPIGSSDVFLSYLPLAHILERAAEAAMLVNGASIGFFQGVKSSLIIFYLPHFGLLALFVLLTQDIRKLDDDIKTLAPTLFVGVPKVYQRVMLGIQKKIAAAGLVPRLVFNIAFSLQRLALQSGKLCCTHIPWILHLNQSRVPRYFIIFRPLNWPVEQDCIQQGSRGSRRSRQAGSFWRSPPFPRMP